MKKIRINISDKIFYVLIVALAIVAIGVIVYAQVPNPGHSIADIAPPSGCDASQVLQWTGSDWTCTPLDVPKTYVGTTSASYTGAEVGGYSGGDDKCSTQYGPRARMCVGTDFANGRPTGLGWYNTFGFPPDTTALDSTIYECEGWTNSGGSVRDAPYWQVSGQRPSFNGCETSQLILCCR